MRISGPAVRMAATVAAALLAVAGCGSGGGGEDGGQKGHGAGAPARTHPFDRLPDVGPRLGAQIPEDSRQVVTVRGEGVNSPAAVVTWYQRNAKGWERKASWSGHNGRNGWSADHRENDLRTPVGVFTLSDAGGVLPDPGARLPYTHSRAFTPPPYWPAYTRHDFDYVIAIDYNRLRGTSPLDPTRPRGQSRGGGIWLHPDHGRGTSGCVSVPKPAMAHLLRGLDPAQHPVVVMGDRADLAA